MLLAGLALGEELQCDFRGLQATVRYDASGHIALLDGDELLTELQGDPLALDRMAGVSCTGDVVRFVWGMEGSATMAVEKQHVDFGPILDVLSSERFDPGRATFRRARYHGRRDDPAGVWRWVDGHEAELDDDQKQEVARWLARSDELPLLEASWGLRSDSSRAHTAGQALGVRIAAGRHAGGDYDAAEQLLRTLEETPATCEGIAAALEARGEKGPARKQRKHCAELMDPG